MKIPKFSGIINECPVFSLKAKFLQCRKNIFQKQILSMSHRVLFHMRTGVCFKYFANDCLWKQFFVFEVLPDLFQLDFLTVLVTLRLFSQWQHRIRATKLQKSAKSCPTC